VQEGVVKKLLFSIAVLMLFAPVPGSAQQQPEEKMLFGRVQSVDSSGTEITLTDGTRLVTPPGARLRPGSVEQGMLVLAVYRQGENGDKVLTRLAREQREPAAETGPKDKPGTDANSAAQCFGLPRRSPVMFGAVCA
jgi:hypothetical protein